MSALIYTESFQRASKMTSGAVLLLAMIVLAGWMFDVPALKSVIPGLATMKPMTAVGLGLGGLALWLLQSSQPESVRRAGQVCGIAVAVLGAVALGEYIFNWNLKIDQVLFNTIVVADATADGSLHPGRMAPATASMLLVIGAALSTLKYREQSGKVEALAAGAALIAIIALSGYLYGSEALYRFGPYASVAVNTSAAGLLLALGTLCAFPDRGMMKLISGDGVGSAMARRLLPAAFLIPSIIGWARWQGELAGLYATGFGIALFTVSNIVVFSGITLAAASYLNRIDLARQRTDEALNIRKYFERILREKEETLRLLISGVKDYAIIMLDSDGRIASWNDGAQRIKGYRPDEIIGQHFSRFYPAEDIADGKPARELKTAIAEGWIEDEGWRIRNDGSRFWGHVTITAMRDDDGNLRGFSKVTRDFSEHKQFEQSLQEANQTQARLLAEIQLTNKDLAQFAYVASHDLQEPLRMVASYTQLLADRYEGQLDARADKYIRYAVDGATRMQNLINDLLSLSRVGKNSIPLVPTDCGAVVGDVLQNLGKAVEESEATIVVADDLPTVIGNRTQLGQLFQNLIENAIKFRGDKKPKVEISASRGSREWVFQVHDNGIGIAPEYHERIFEIFQRLHQRAQYKGTGIGLALVKKIVERHGGRVWLESAVGAGTRFLFTIPEIKK